MKPQQAENVTGKAMPSVTRVSNPMTEKTKVDRWFCDQLAAMKGDDAFVCLMVCFPLIELIARHELEVPDDQDVTFSDDSPALHWFAGFMQIPDAQSRLVWDAFRNGLLHRAMIKDAIPFVIDGRKTSRPAEMKNNAIYVYVWELRDAVVGKLKEHHRKLWKMSSSPLPAVYSVQ